MARIFQKDSTIKLPQRGREAQNEEEGRQHKGVSECPVCHNVHYKKRWHPSIQVVREHEKDKTLKVTGEEICRACLMQKGHLFEGELIVEKLPERSREGLLELVKGFGERALAEDPQDRILNIEDTEGGLRVTTAENQLADRLGKKIRDAFKKVTVTFSHSEEPYRVDRVHVLFEEK